MGAYPDDDVSRSVSCTVGPNASEEGHQLLRKPLRLDWEGMRRGFNGIAYQTRTVRPTVHAPPSLIPAAFPAFQVRLWGDGATEGPGSTSSGLICAAAGGGASGTFAASGRGTKGVFVLAIAPCNSGLWVELLRPRAAFVPGR